jgi:SAM-dependent methyltransferase
VSGVGALVARCIIPQTVRRKLRDWQAETVSFRLLAAGGYDTSRVQAWAEKLGNKRSTGILSAAECARLECQPYFSHPLFARIWPGNDMTDALLLAADNCLYGLHLEETLLGNWQETSRNNLSSELNMIRVLNESVLHAVRFCGGWEYAYSGHGYPGMPVMQRLAGLLDCCPGRVLDIGAGGLPFYSIMRSRPAWIASDLNLPALRIMRLALGLDSGHLICHDAQAIPFPDSSFHVVVSRYVIENVLRPEDMLREVARVLCPGGSFLVLVPKVMFGHVGVKYFTNRRTFPARADFERLCREAGFEIADFYTEESVYHLRTPGVVDSSTWSSGFRCPDCSSGKRGFTSQDQVFPCGHSYPVVDEIPVLVSQRLRYPTFGCLGSLGTVSQAQ